MKAKLEQVYEFTKTGKDRKVYIANGNRRNVLLEVLYRGGLATLVQHKYD